MAAIGQLLERLVNNPKISNSRFEPALLAMSCFVLRKDILSYFPLKPSSLSIVVAQPDKRLSSGTQKKVFCVEVVQQERNAWFIRMNELMVIL